MGKSNEKNIRKAYKNIKHKRTIINNGIEITFFYPLIIFLLFFHLSFPKETNYISEISIIINGTGTQQILSDGTDCDGPVQFNSIPNKTFINGVLQNYNDKKVYNLTNKINNITIQWYYQLTNCNLMFKDLHNITKLDLSKFDSSKVTDMRCMFNNLISLQSIDLSNFDTSLVTSMRSMFSNCRSLKTIDVSSFNTSSAINISYMFSECISLISLDLSSFNISKAITIDRIVLGCFSLKKLNLLNFEIKTAVIHYDEMFSNVNNNLLYCIDKSKAEKIKSQLNDLSNNNCNDICFTNNQSKFIPERYKCVLNCSEDEAYSYNYNNICYKSCPEGTHKSNNNNHICEDDLYCAHYYNYNKTQCFDYIPEGYFLYNSTLKIIDKCDSKCQNCSLESFINNLCISCNNANGYYQKYNDNANNYNFVNCYNETKGYFLNEDNKYYHPCYNTCETCLGQGNDLNHNCLSCKNNYIFIKDFFNNSCYENCLYYYYFNSDGKYFCTEEKKCPENYTKLIPAKNKCVENCVNDNIYKYEFNNICYETYPIFTDILSTDNYLYEIDSTIEFFSEEEIPSINSHIYELNSTIESFLEDNKENIKEFFNETDIFSIFYTIKKNQSNEASKDGFLLNIKKELKNNGLNTLLDQMSIDKKDVILEFDNVIYQITNTNNEHNKNISNITLGDCEQTLKEYYNIINEGLLILKIEYNITGSLIPVIDYEVYHPSTKELLNLSLCNNSKVNLSIPVSINEKDLIKHDPKSDYYVDNCYPYTTDEGTDIVLKDRHLEFNRNNMSLCERI